MLQEIVEDSFQAQYPWLTIHKGEHNDAEGGFHLRMLIKIIQHDLCYFTPFPFNPFLCPYFYKPSSFIVSLDDSLCAMDNAPCWKIRARYDCHQVFNPGLWIFKEHEKPANNLSKVVGRDICGHTNSNT